ncbi:glutaredoxin domain-containing protein [Actinoplanes sp. NPDC051513]|uniref:glutaredoxin domain-containing protein n=1 Tax=Actinoplanes sp. NPDC051513 TaxID=3363908 RepID=UPI003793FFF3
MMRRWGLSISVFALALVFGAAELIAGNVVAAVGLFVLFAVLAALVSPRAFPASVTDAQARALSAADGRPIVYWRPGCPFCMRLRATVGRDAGRLHWVDIWADPDGAASVRAVADGNETVPTVIAGGEAMVNPRPEVVRELVRNTAA